MINICQGCKLFCDCEIQTRFEKEGVLEKSWDSLQPSGSWTTWRNLKYASNCPFTTGCYNLSPARPGCRWTASRNSTAATAPNSSPLRGGGPPTGSRGHTPGETQHIRVATQWVTKPRLFFQFQPPGFAPLHELRPAEGEAHRGHRGLRRIRRSRLEGRFSTIFKFSQQYIHTCHDTSGHRL